MKITSSRRDDILKEKEEYDKKMAEYNEADKARDKQKYLDEQAVFEPIRKYLESNLNKFDLLDFAINLNRDWDWDESDKYANDSIEVSVKCNDVNHFDEKVALSWNYDVKIVKGEVEAESSSWSGLKAVTKEQLESLKQTVSAIEFLQDVDWKSLIYRKLPSSIKYYEQLPERPQSRNFEEELLEEDIRDSFGKGIGFKGTQIVDYEASWRGNVDGYYFFYGETPKQYKCVFISKYYLNQDDFDGSNWINYISRYSKENVLKHLYKKDYANNTVTIESMKK